LAKKPPNSYDVAKVAGVSQSAVSRAFSPGRSIADATRKKIFKAAQELGYKPNAIARSMSTARTQTTQRSGMVGVIVTRLEDPFFAKIVNSFSRKLQQMGWHVLLFSVENEAEVDDALSELLQYQVDGVIISSAILSQKMAEGCYKHGTPVVLYNRYTKDKGISSVRVENFEGGRMIANLLLDSNHERIAFIAGTQGEPTSDEREKGFTGRLHERGTELYQREEGDYSFESGYQAAVRLLSLAEPPDAIFCASDVMALGVIQAAKLNFNLNIPEDLSVVGFDDIPAAAWPGHQLTTIRQPVDEMTQETVNILIEKMENPEYKAKTCLVPGKLVLRHSVQSR
jgi:DNA-binding LacI/PurR family transcriptional regulator